MGHLLCVMRKEGGLSINTQSLNENQRRETAGLKVLIERECTLLTILRSVCAVSCNGSAGGSILCSKLLGAGHDTRLLVVSYALLKKVCLAAKGNVLHKVERVGGPVHLLVAQRHEQPVGDKLNVLLHEVCVHAEQSAGECLGKELLLDSHSISDDVTDGLLARAVTQVAE